MKFAGPLNPYFESFLRLVYPSTCGVCERLLEIDESGLCRACRDRLSALQRAYDKVSIDQKFDYVDDGWALFPYESPVREILTSLKFSRKRWLLKVFRDAVASWAGILAAETHYDALIPIPLDRERLIERQFNQSELIAGLIAKNTGISVEKSILRKRWKTPAQSQLSREARSTNLRYAFKAHADEKIRGKSFLLIDDILTTGSTVEEAAAVLKRHGAKRVDVFALASTQKGGKKK